MDDALATCDPPPQQRPATKVEPAKVQLPPFRWHRYAAAHHGLPVVVAVVVNAIASGSDLETAATVVGLVVLSAGLGWWLWRRM